MPGDSFIPSENKSERNLNQGLTEMVFPANGPERYYWYKKLCFKNFKWVD